MAQSITIKIGTSEYPLVAATPEQEQIMRLAADEVNAMLAKYDVKFPGRPIADKLAFVALQEAMGKLTARRNVAVVTDEVKALDTELENYLKDK